MIGKLSEAVIAYYDRRLLERLPPTEPVTRGELLRSPRLIWRLVRYRRWPHKVKGEPFLFQKLRGDGVIRWRRYGDD